MNNNRNKIENIVNLMYVLLILAGVSIAMLTGKNGILTQAKTAKEKTEISSLIEQVQVNILGKQAENNGGEVTSGVLKEILEKYFKGVPGKDEITTEWLETAELTSKEEYGGYEIKLSDIYNGEISSSKIIHFTVNGEEYETKENVTWEEFLNEQECQGLSKESHYGYIGKNFEFMGGANRRNRRIHLFRR